jgi:hypothetical protein
MNHGEMVPSVEWHKGEEWYPHQATCPNLGPANMPRELPAKDKKRERKASLVKLFFLFTKEKPKHVRQRFQSSVPEALLCIYFLLFNTTLFIFSRERSQCVIVGRTEPYTSF